MGVQPLACAHGLGLGHLGAWPRPVTTFHPPKARSESGRVDGRFIAPLRATGAARIGGIVSMATPTRVQLDRYFYRVVAIKRSSGFAQVWLLERSGDSPPSTIYDKRRAAKTFDQADEAAVVNELSNWILLNHENVLPLIKISRLNFRIAALMELCKGTLQGVLPRFHGHFQVSSS